MSADAVDAYRRDRAHGQDARTLDAWTAALRADRHAGERDAPRLGMGPPSREPSPARFPGGP